MRLSQTTRHVSLLVVQIALVTTLCGLLLVWSERHNHRFDLTPTQSYVLSDATHKIAANIDQPIRITFFYNSQESGQRRQMEDVLRLFTQESPQISYRLLDLDRSPALAKKYGVSTFNTGVVERDGEVLEIKGVDEEEITNALLKLTRRTARTLCFVTGHGEHSPLDPSDRNGYSEVGKALEKENFAVRTIDVVPPEGVPADCTVVIFAGPSRNLLPGEADQIAHYLDAGGRVLVMVDPDASQSVVDFLERYGVRAGNDLVVDERNRFYGSDSFMPRVPIFDEGTFRSNLDTAAVFALARTVSPVGEPDSPHTVLLLAMTSPDSWAHVDGGVVPDGKVQFRRETDRPGPLPVGVMVTDKRSAAPTPGGTDGTGEEGRPRGGQMIVFGDSDFASNLYLNLLGNKDLFMSSIGLLAEDPELVVMRRKGLPRSSLSPVSLTAEQGRLIFWFAVVVAPAAFATLGVFISWRRQRRASM
jgi:gliding motility-associatede transport system auxiliary component